jgi:histidinol dehydrogenase
MLARIDLREGCADPRRLLPRARLDVAAALAEVRPICADVRDRGVAAVLDAGERFDGVRPQALRVPPARLAAALAAVSPELRAALTEAARRVRLVATATAPADRTVSVSAGATVTCRWLPARRVGVYVPAGLLAYPSSVVMNVVPAQVAGVSEIALASPPQPANDGWPHPTVLAAAALLGVDEVYAAGGAQAVAMFAYGVTGCPPVDLVTGPGNVYVAAAKRLVRGDVGTDAEAGPTEIAILADGTADPELIAVDLVAQAEHDPLAAALLVTCAPALADRVDAALARRVPAARHRDRVEAALAGQSATVLVRDIEHGLAVVDAWAPEHLEVLTAAPAAVAARVRCAGAVFVGPASPVALGDYLAGSNHVLPTGGTARFAGGLSARTFLREMQVIHYDQSALAAVAGSLSTLGAAEDLPGHVDAVTARLR